MERGILRRTIRKGTGVTKEQSITVIKRVGRNTKNGTVKYK